MKIDGQLAVVTGAGSGLGSATARMLAKRGARVIAMDASQQALDSLTADVSMREALQPLCLDVTEADAMEQAFERIRVEQGTPRILVTCAGILGPARVFRIDKTTGRFTSRSLEAFRRVIEVNLIGTFNAVRLFAAGLAGETAAGGQDNGVIVTTASVAAYEALSGQAAYGSSKAGVASMTLPLARELARFGIRVVSLAPGTFRTAMYEHVPAHTRERLIADVPFPTRPGEPEEFADMVCALVGNQMMNGSVVRIDGGVRMREPSAFAASGVVQ